MRTLVLSMFFLIVFNHLSLLHVKIYKLLVVLCIQAISYVTFMRKLRMSFPRILNVNIWINILTKFPSTLQMEPVISLTSVMHSAY